MGLLVVWKAWGHLSTHLKGQTRAYPFLRGYSDECVSQHLRKATHVPWSFLGSSKGDVWPTAEALPCWLLHQKSFSIESRNPIEYHQVEEVWKGLVRKESTRTIFDLARPWEEGLWQGDLAALIAPKRNPSWYSKKKCFPQYRAKLIVSGILLSKRQG